MDNKGAEIRQVTELSQGVRPGTSNEHRRPDRLKLKEPILATKEPIFSWEQGSPGSTRLISSFAIYPAIQNGEPVWLRYEHPVGGYGQGYWSPHEDTLSFSMGVHHLVLAYWGIGLKNPTPVLTSNFTLQDKLQENYARTDPHRGEWLSSDRKDVMASDVELFRFRDTQDGGPSFDVVIYPARLLDQRRWLEIAQQVVEPEKGESKRGALLLSAEKVADMLVKNRAQVLDPIFAPLIAALQQQQVQQ